jgi:glutamyl-tRNA reductase
MSSRQAPPPPLALVGCDFRIASAAWRGALALTPEERAELAASLTEAAGARGLVVLETCNRTEWIVETDQPRWAADLLVSWMQRLWAERGPKNGTRPTLPRPAVHLETEAVRHLVRVAAGLESFVLGEREIAAQVNRSLESARENATASPLLNELGQAAARAVRHVEKASRFRESGRGVHSLVVERLSRHAAELPHRLRLGVAGLGTIGKRTADALEQAGLPASVTFNRTARHESMRPLADIPAAARSLDVLVVATGARRPVIRAAELAGDERESSLLIVDLGSPAQVDGEDASPAVTLEGLDELLAATVRSADAADRESAESLVEQGLDEFLLAWRKSPAGALLRHLQQSRDELGTERLPSLLQEHLADLPDERRRRLEKALRGLVLERDRLLLEHLQASVAPLEGDPS